MGYDDQLVFMFNNGTMLSPVNLYTTECVLDITYFPFDTQYCKIIITKWMMYENVWLSLFDANDVKTSNHQNSVWNIVEISKHLEASFPDYTPDVVVPDHVVTGLWVMMISWCSCLTMELC